MSPYAQHKSNLFRKRLPTSPRRRRHRSTLLCRSCAAPFERGLAPCLSLASAKPRTSFPKSASRGRRFFSLSLSKGSRLYDKLEIVPDKLRLKIKSFNQGIRAALEIPRRFQADVAQEKSGTVKRFFKYEGEIKYPSCEPKCRKVHEIQTNRDNGGRSCLAAKDLPELCQAF